jgi:hypothetical protein
LCPFLLWSPDRRVDPRDKECRAKQQSLLEAESESSDFKGEQWAVAAQPEPVVWDLSGFKWFETGWREKPGHSYRWG